MLVVLITPPPVDEEGRKEYAKYDPFLFCFLTLSFNMHTQAA
jgi:hypothetical protein